MYCVIFRTGGTDNFKWHRSLGFSTRQEADAARIATARMGYPSYAVNLTRSLLIGLPDSYSLEPGWFTYLHDA